MLGDCDSTYPLIESGVSYGRMVSNSFFFSTPIIMIEVADGTACAHGMCVSCTSHIGVTLNNLLVFIMFGSVYCCLCGDMSAQRVIHPSLLHVIVAHCDTL